jgi:hypothetical protein
MKCFIIWKSFKIVSGLIDSRPTQWKIFIMCTGLLLYEEHINLYCLGRIMLSREWDDQIRNAYGGGEITAYIGCTT